MVNSSRKLVSLGMVCTGVNVCVGLSNSFLELSFVEGWNLTTWGNIHNKPWVSSLQFHQCDLRKSSSPLISAFGITVTLFPRKILRWLVWAQFHGSAYRKQRICAYGSIEFWAYCKRISQVSREFWLTRHSTLTQLAHKFATWTYMYVSGEWWL